MSQFSYYTLLKNASALSILVPLICCFIKRKTLIRTVRVLFLYFTVSAVHDILSRLFAGKFVGAEHYVAYITWLNTVPIKGIFAGHYNNILYAMDNAFTLFECCCLLVIYYFEFKNIHIKRAILVAAIGYILFFILLFQMRSFDKPASITCILEAALMFILSLIFFYKLLKKVDLQMLQDDYFIWINSGILVYFSLALLLFLVDGYLERCPNLIFKALWSFNLLANIAFNLLSARGIWKQKPTELY